MNIQLFPHALNQSQVIGTFQNNTIMKGKVLELLPNNLAIVEFGNEKMTAKTEGFLKRDTQYLFQVKKTTDSVLLKVIDSPDPRASTKASLPKFLIQQLGLPDTPEMEKIIGKLNDRHIPLNQGILEQAGEYLSKMKNPGNLVKPFVWLLEKQLPLSSSTVKLAQAAMTPAEKPDVFLNTLNELANRNELPISVKEPLKNYLKEGTIDPPTSETNLLAFFRKSVDQPKTFKLLAPFIEQFLKENRPALLSQKQPGITLPEFTNAVKQSETLTGFLHKLFPNQPTASLIGKLQQLIKKTPELKVLFQNEIGVKPFLQQMFSKLGFQHEQQFLPVVQHQEAIPPDAQNNMKAMLLQIAQDTSSQPVVHQKAETVLQQLTLQQLQFIGADKGWVQWVMQLPLPIRDTFKSASFYWEGKTTANNALDPEHCHILCYLDLEQLKETLVQIRIQDRFVSLTIHNDTHQLDSQLKKWESLLKDQLSRFNYQLVSLSQNEKISPVLKGKVTQVMAMDQQNLDVKI